VLCREGAKELSSIKPTLLSLNPPVQMIAVGIDRVSLDEFIQLKFFDGPIYLEYVHSFMRAFRI